MACGENGLCAIVVVVSYSNGSDSPKSQQARVSHSVEGRLYGIPAAVSEPMSVPIEAVLGKVWCSGTMQLEGHDDCRALNND